MAEEHGWRWCSYDACRRQLAKRIDRQRQAYHRQPEVFRSAFDPSIAQDPESWGAGELYTSDHKQLDVVVRFQNSLVRPWLTTWIDWRTRRVMGWELGPVPNSTTIMSAFRHAIRDGGHVPPHVKIDNGKDYDAWTFHGQTKKQRQSRIKIAVDEATAAGIFNLAGTEAHFATAYCPNAKARQERFHGNLTAFARRFHTYTGIDVDSKPEKLAEVLENPRLVPSFDEVKARLGDFIAGFNANADHQIDDLVEDGQRLSPDQAWARWCVNRRELADPYVLDLFVQQWHKPLSVGRNGIAIAINGVTLRYGQFQPELRRFKARLKADRPMIRVSFDPSNVSSVRVYDAHYRYVCTAPLNAQGGMHGTAIAAEKVKELRHAQNSYRKSLKHVAKHRLERTLTKEERLALLAAESGEQVNLRTGEVTGAGNGAVTVEKVRTPLDGAAREIAREQLKIAVGAESMSEPRQGQPSLSDLLAKARASYGPREPERPMIDGLAVMRERNPSWE